MLVGEAEIQMILANTTVLESSVVCRNCFAVFSKIVYNSAHSLRHLCPFRTTYPQ